MPSFYARPPPGLPITPPESMYYSHQYAMGPNGLAYGMHEQKGGYDGYNQLPPYHPGYRQQNLQFPPGLPHPGNNARYNDCNTLPPLNGMKPEENMQMGWNHRNDAKSAPAKVEEKPTGGVAQVLDYEIEDMAEFVTSMAIGMYVVTTGVHIPLDQSVNDDDRILPGNQSQQTVTSFKKFVFTILQSTRLPSSTVILSLDYLSHRMNNCPPTNQQKGTGQLYRLCTVSLLLASKFLDDNTFQNRSWADVTGLPVAELNTLEKEWLAAIGWQLHVARPGYTGFDSWKASWDSFISRKQVVHAPVLAPLNTNISNRRHTLSFSHQTFSPQQQQPQTILPHGYIGDRLRHHQQQQQHHMATMNDGGYWCPELTPSGQPSPPSAPETGPATPNWDMPMNWPTHFGGKPQPSFPPRMNLGPPHSSQMYPVMHQWMAQCNCVNCMPANGRLPTPCMYPIGSNNFMMNYGQQVVG
ncbi:hypothetical protein ABW19_dt0201076 [Dactylella cylindrospora]|nr:hypothetical protein ABW19_dt0201076 [Dactylella cylindrospora]